MERPPIWLLGAVTLGGTLGIHIFAPALALAARSMNAAPADLQISIGIYVLGLALGQLVHGPLADRFGRRPVLLAGMLTYVAGGAMSLAATGPLYLSIARLLQAFGGCSGLVIARAIIRDTSAGAGAAGDMAKLNLVILLGPGLGPIAGGLVTSLWGWKAPLVALVLVGVFNFTAVGLWLGETGERSARGTTLSSYGILLRSPAFLAFSLGGGLATTAWYAFIGAAPFVYERIFHLTPSATGLHLGAIVAGAWMGSLVTSKLQDRSAQWFMVQGQRLSLLMAVTLFAIMMSGASSAMLITATMFLYTCGVGMAGPASLVRAISLHPRVSGTAAGLYGFIQMAVGAVAAALVGIGPDPAVAAAIALMVGGCVALVCFSIGRRHATGPRQGSVGP